MGASVLRKTITRLRSPTFMSCWSVNRSSSALLSAGAETLAAGVVFIAAAFITAAFVSTAGTLVASAVKLAGTALAVVVAAASEAAGFANELEMTAGLGA